MTISGVSPDARPRPGRRLAVLAMVLTGAACLAACGGSHDEASGTASTTPSSPSPSALTSTSVSVSASPSPSSSASSSPSSSASSSASPSVTATPSADVTGTTADPTSVPAAPSASSRLVGAADLPALQAGDTWTTRSTSSHEPPGGFGTCQRFAMTSIGAEQVAVRRFSAGRDKEAGELVATFPDALTARRAYAVLDAWRARCAGRLRAYHRVDVGKTQPVSVPGGQAGWYLLVYGPVKGDPDTGYFDAQGAALVGSRIAVLAMRETGQNYDYPPGHEPLVAALAAASRKLS